MCSLLIVEHMFGHAREMIKPEDLDNPERMEQHRRSVAMLSTGIWALRREDALLLLGAVVASLQDRPAA